ncbi:MAG: AtpZ/AtpI family protein [Elusimicrobia bacterium]|nr:AtpZ/AtpI family protein [Elusimicrobiota bacterium]
MALSVLLGLYVGYRLDKRWNLSPWMTLLGAALGFGLGLYNFLRPYLANDRSEE